MGVRAIRGATALTGDDAEEMREAVAELVLEVLARNGLGTDALVSILFTATPDLVSAFPATAARSLDIADVPLMCAQEIDVTGAMPRVVRLMAHVETHRTRAQIEHVFLRGAQALRTDLVR